MAPRGKRKAAMMLIRRSLRIRRKMWQSAGKLGEKIQILPQELIIEILAWLPSSSLVRFKCVSKSWRAVIQERFLVQKHAERLEPTYLYKQRSAKDGDLNFKFLSTRDGLLLERSNFSKEYRIQNPLTKQVLAIPNPLEQHLQMELTYSKVAKKYKLLYLYLKQDPKSGEHDPKAGGCKILTVDSDLKWRNIEVPELQEGIDRRRESKFIDSTLFVLKQDHPQLVCFQTETERATIVENIPEACITDAESFSSVSWNGNFALFKVDCHPGVGWKVDAWVLANFKKQKWDRSNISISLSFVTKYVPEATTITVYNKPLRYELLCLSVNSGEHFFGYYFIDRDAKAVTHLVLHDQVLLGICRRSLTFLEGMQPEATDHDTYDYETGWLYDTRN